MPETPARAKHDEAYKLLFSSVAVVEGLLNATAPDFAKLVDMSTLRKLSPSFVKSEGLRQRHGDMLWKVRLRQEGKHPVYIPLEFQSRPVNNMAFRVYEYVNLMLREADVTEDTGPEGAPPIVMPVVVYNGYGPWNAATDLRDWLMPDACPVLRHVLGLQMRRKYILADLKTPKFLDLPADNWFSVLAEWESARWTEDTVRLVELWRRATESGDSSIVRGFDALRQQTDSWLRIPEIEPGAAALPGRRKTMIRHEETWLAENLRKREEELRQEGRREGVREGRREGVREGRREGVQEGRREGVREGRREGVREGRRLLLRQLVLQKFGPDAVAELSRVLEEPSDSDRTEGLARAIIECATAAEFIARAREL